MRTVFDDLRQIQTRPGMYIGCFVELEEFEALFLQRVQEPILTQEARRYNREELDVPRCAQGPRFSDAKRLYRITLSDGYTLLAVEKEAEGPKVWFESLFAQWDMKEELERCFGPLVWRDSLEDFLGEKRLEL